MSICGVIICIIYQILDDTTLSTLMNLVVINVCWV